MKRVFYLVLVLVILGIIYTACEKQNPVDDVQFSEEKSTGVLTKGITEKRDKNQKIIHGIVDGAGNIVAGSGFAVTRAPNDLYIVTFDTPFSALPAFTATVIAKTTLSAQHGYIAENNFSPSHFAFRIPLSPPSQDGFSFIAIGPRFVD